MVPGWQLISFAVPKAVTNLTVAYVNTTAVQLSWLKQDDFKPGYSYQVTVLGDGQANKPPQSTTIENYTVTSLTPGENYTFQVLTVVQGVRSTVETTTSHTSMILKLAVSLSCRSKLTLTHTHIPLFSFAVPKTVTNLTVANVMFCLLCKSTRFGH